MDAVDAAADRVRAEADAQPTDNLSGIVVHPDEVVIKLN